MALVKWLNLQRLGRGLALSTSARLVDGSWSCCVFRAKVSGRQNALVEARFGFKRF